MVVTAGDVLVFKHNGVAIENIGPDQGDNNIASINGVLTVQTAGTVDVYFKVYNDGGYSVWMSGYVAPTLTHDWYLVGSLNSWKENETYGFIANEDNANEVMLLGQHLEAGTELKLKNKETWVGYYQVNELCADVVSKGEGDENDNILITKTGLYDFYWDFVNNKLWIGFESEEETPSTSVDTSNSTSNEQEESSSSTNPITQSYIVEINGVAHNLVKNETPDLTDGKVAEYMIKELAVEEGDEVVFKINGEIVTSIGPTAGENNISLVNGILTIKSTCESDIYFKVYEDGYSVWVSGYVAPVLEHDWHLVGSFIGWEANDNYGFVANSETENEVMLLGVSLLAGDEVKVIVKAASKENHTIDFLIKK